MMSHRLNALEALCDSSFEDRRMLLGEAWMKPIACLLCIVTALSVVNSDASGQLLPDNTGESNRRMEEISNQNNSRPMSVPKETKVIVDADKPRGVLMP